MIFVSFFVFGKDKVLDLGELEITGEVRRPNVNKVYSKKYFDKAMSNMAKQELQNFEAELLMPVRASIRKKRK